MRDVGILCGQGGKKRPPGNFALTRNGCWPPTSHQAPHTRFLSRGRLVQSGTVSGALPTHTLGCPQAEGPRPPCAPESCTLCGWDPARPRVLGRLQPLSPSGSGRTETKSTLPLPLTCFFRSRFDLPLEACTLTRPLGVVQTYRHTPRSAARTRLAFLTAEKTARARGGDHASPGFLFQARFSHWLGLCVYCAMKTHCGNREPHLGGGGCLISLLASLCCSSLQAQLVQQDWPGGPPGGCKQHMGVCSDQDAQG